MFVEFVIVFCVILTILCNSFKLFESLSHMSNQESHVYSWSLGKIYLVHFLVLPRSKFEKSEPGKFIPNFSLKHVITRTNIQK